MKGEKDMSKENVKLFYEELAKNEALQEKFKVIGKKYEGQTTDEVQMDLIYQNEILPIAKESGFEFTLAELKEYKQEVTQPQSGKVSDEELGAVAGGQHVDCACIIGGGGGNGLGEACACVLIGFADNAAFACFGTGSYT